MTTATSSRNMFELMPHWFEKMLDSKPAVAARLSFMWKVQVPSHTITYNCNFQEGLEKHFSPCCLTPSALFALKPQGAICKTTFGTSYISSETFPSTGTCVLFHPMHKSRPCLPCIHLKIKSGGKKLTFAWLKVLSLPLKYVEKHFHNHWLRITK